MWSHKSMLGWWSNAVQTSLVLAEAQTVIALRIMALNGFWSVTPYENRRMVSEKIWATTKSVTETQRALLRGATAPDVASAAILPFRQKTRANARRLSKRGPKRT